MLKFFRDQLFEEGWIGENITNIKREGKKKRFGQIQKTLEKTNQI